MKYTKEQKQEYFASIRRRWAESKKLAELDADAKKEFDEVKTKIDIQSFWSYYFTRLEMKSKGLSGYPYLHCRTFKKWLADGLKVKKGEKAILEGVAWKHPIDKDGKEDEDYMYPMVYKLFHYSQVEEI